MNFDPKEQGVFALKPGDVLVTEGSGSLRAVGAASVWSGEVPGMVCFQNTLLRLRPRPSTDPRFLAWWCRYAFGDGLFASIATGANIFHISADRVRALPMTYLAPPRQRAIADYLDSETARIDTLLAKKRLLANRVLEHIAAFTSHVIWDGVDRSIPLMHRVQAQRPIMYGIVLPGPSVDQGVPIVKGGDVAARRPTLADLNRTTAEIERPYARARLRPADLVFAIRGGIGDVEIVPPELNGANITQDVARVAPATGVDPGWLRHVLGTHQVVADVDRRVTGATIRGINIGELKHVAIPASSAARQAADVATLGPAVGRQDRMATALSGQIDLLVEHRQALITAAVAGELEISGTVA